MLFLSQLFTGQLLIQYPKLSPSHRGLLILQDMANILS